MAKKQRKVNERVLYDRKIKKPPTFIYNVLGRVWQALFMKKYGVKVTYNEDPRKAGQHILISNHASRNDYIFVGVPTLPTTYNFVAGYNEFYRSHLRGVFNLLQVIPKKNFTPDVYTLKEVSRVIKEGGNIVLFPEGMNSIAGMNQPVAIGTGKFIKHFKLPVYYSVIKGGFLSFPKHTNNEYPGTIEVTFDKMFSPSDLEKLSPEEIEKIVNEKLYHDDYKWNAIYKHVYKTGGKSAEGLSDVLYICPKCKKELTMVSKENTIWCTECGNGAIVDDTYALTPLDETSILPKDQSDWFKWQRSLVKDAVKDKNFSFSAKVKLGVLPDYKLLKNLKTSEIVGEGTLTISHNGLSYVGTNNNEPFEFNIELKDVPTYGMCTDTSRFYTFLNGKFIEFYPETPCVLKFFLITEELHRLHGGKWQDFDFNK